MNYTSLSHSFSFSKQDYNKQGGYKQRKQLLSFVHSSLKLSINYELLQSEDILGSIVVSIPACHAGDRGSIPRRGG